MLTCVKIQIFQEKQKTDLFHDYITENSEINCVIAQSYCTTNPC